MFSQTIQYAIRAVVMLSYEEKGVALGNGILAHRTKIPTSYLSKVMQGLVKSGIVESRRGVGGGFRLCQPPSKITLLDVVNAVEPLPRIKGCPLGLKSHGSMLCSVHASLDEAMAEVERVLSCSTIADLIAEPSRPRPLLETVAYLQISSPKVESDS